MTDFPLYLIPLLPLLGAAFNLLVGRKLPRGVVHYVGCGVVAAAATVAYHAVFSELLPLWRQAHEAAGGEGGGVPRLTQTLYVWLSAGDFKVPLAFLLDPLSAVMTLVVTTVGFLIHVYSMGYMAHDKDYARFFGYLNLFTGAMLMLVLGSNLAVMFIGWEGVGLCSYLLIGFWYHKEVNAYSGRKAFVVNRIGDFGFLLGIFLLIAATGTIDFGELAQKTEVIESARFWGLPVALLASLCLFVGATGKSAQLPLYIWLPDAMAGPTPVSALIHAATMVTAGVYMVTRMNFLYALAPEGMAVVAIIGSLTALFAATIGIAQTDIKKVLAYSTISQLGFMFAAVGVGAYSAGIFHLTTHAFFKAGLFLGAGSVMHAMGDRTEIMGMGGLRRKIPWTHGTFLIYTLAIAGIPPLAGFFSKDEILAGVFVAHFPHLPWLGKAVYGVLMAAAMCTAFYMFRLYFLVFSGECRADEHAKAHIHESPGVMTGPLALLAAGAVCAGALGFPEVFGLPNLFHHWLAPVVAHGGLGQAATAVGHAAGVAAGAAAHGAAAGGAAHGAAAAGGHALSAAAEAGLMALALLVALAGIGLAWALYRGGPRPAVERLVTTWPRLTRLVRGKYFVDELYDRIVVRPLRFLSFVCARDVDALVIDKLAVNGSARAVGSLGWLTQRLQNGDVQRYLAAVVVGAAAIVFLASRPPARFSARVEGQRISVDASRDGRGGRREHGRDLEYRWEFAGRKQCDKRSPDPRAWCQMPSAGRHLVRLEVIDRRWGTSSSGEVEVETRSGGAGQGAVLQGGGR